MSDDELKLSTAGFASMMLQLSPYEWQAKVGMALERYAATGKRQNVAVCAPNGSGKDNVIIPMCSYWWEFYFPHGRTVITSKSDLQLSSQTLPSLNAHWRKFGWDEPVQSPRYQMVTPTGGVLTAFVTNDGLRAEGHHSRPGEPLLMIVNEAKGVDASIFEGIFRCTPDVLILISSPGMREGVFYDCFTKNSAQWTTIRAGLADCPHISRDKIDSITTTYGPDHPVTRSTLHGEFMKQMDGEQNVLLPEEFESCVLFPPTWKPGFKFAFFDFADGRAENVMCMRDGNKFWIEDAWREQNEDAVVGRALYLIAKNNLKQHQVKGDAAAKSILDKMASSGMAIGRQNFGAIDKTGTYKSWSAMAWLETAHKIRNREIIIPDDAVLKSQATTRRKLFEPSGKLAVEDKTKMLRERGLESPDRMDAFVGCAQEIDTSLMIGNRKIINWMDYSTNDDSSTSERKLAAAMGM